MLIYILKSIACLAILIIFYKVFLENESVHTFKRFYLLGALAFSLIVPALVFTEFVEAAPIEEMNYELSQSQAIQVTEDVVNEPVALEEDILDIEPLLWGIYFLGLFFFGLKFVRNLVQIFLRIRKNPKHKLARITQVLMQEKITPHTFFSYIFLNKSKFEANEIPKEVLLHEETHAKQKHSIDVILIELFQVIFWVNPFIYFTKKAIKLNHEFLADQAVLRKNIDESTYKNTLLSYLSPNSEKQYQTLANSINYSSIKKRFTVMKTHTSKKSLLLRNLLLIPLLALLIYSFSETNLIQRDVTFNASTIIKDVNIEIDENGELLLNNLPVALADIAYKARQSNADLEPRYFRNYVTANILYDENHVDLIEAVQVELHSIGISNVEHISKKTSNILNRPDFKPSLYHNKTIAKAQAIRQEKVFKEMDTPMDDNTLLEIVWIEIKNKNEIWFEDKPIAIKELTKKVAEKHQTIGDEKDLEVQIYSTGILYSDVIDEITTEVKKVGAKRVKAVSDEFIMHKSDYLDKVEITPETTLIRTHQMSFVSPQDGASKKQLSEYNALAHKYNTMLLKSQSIQIKMKDVERLEHIYRLMSNKQKEEAAAFPDFPEPPPAPNAPEEPKEPKEPNERAYASNIIKKVIEEQDPYDNTQVEVYRSGNNQIKPQITHIMPSETLGTNALKGQVSKELNQTKTPKVLKGKVSHIPSRTSSNNNDNKLPAPPNIAYQIIDDRPLSNELKKLAKDYTIKRNAYREAGKIYMNNGKGNKTQLYQSYNSLLKLHTEYVKMAKAEGVFAYPSPALAPWILIGEEGYIHPPNPKHLIDHLIELAEKDAVFFYNGDKISTAQAIKIINKNEKLVIESILEKDNYEVVTMKSIK